MTNKQYSTVLFDWDGTLAKSMHLLVKSFKAVVIRQGLMLADKQIINDTFGNWLEGLKFWGVADPESTVVMIKQELDDSMEKLELYPGVGETLARLVKRGKQLAVIALGGVTRSDILRGLTWGSESEVRPLAVFTDRELPWQKPNPLILQRAAELLGGRKADSLWVGNSLNDWEMGRAAKIDTVIFYPPENEKFGQNRVMDQEVGARVIREFKELLKVVV